MADPLTQELETAVERGLGAGALGNGPQRMTGGARNTPKGGSLASAAMAQGPATLSDVVEAMEQRTENLKAHLDSAIRDLQDLREKL